MNGTRKWNIDYLNPRCCLAMQITITIRNLTTTFNWRPVHWDGWLMHVYLWCGCIGGNQAAAPSLCCSSVCWGSKRICNTSRSCTCARLVSGRVFKHLPKSYQQSWNRTMTQAVLFNCTDDAVQILSRFKHLPWLFFLLHNENLLLKWKIVYCKKTSQQPKTAVFE